MLADAPNNRPMVHGAVHRTERQGRSTLPKQTYLMKKQKITLGKKLFLNKETIAALSDRQQQAVAGGATERCMITKIPDLCGGNTAQYGCTTHSLGIACTVIFCV